MAKKYFYRVFYRSATTIITSATKGGSYPDYTISGWTPIPGLAAEVAKMSPDIDGEEPLGDGTQLATGEKIPLEVKIVGFTSANYATIRGAFVNTKVDLLLMDPDQFSTSYAAFGVRLFPKLTVEGGAEPAIVLAGERKYGAGVSTLPFQMVTVT